MKAIQVVGLPGAGKTTGINLFLEDARGQIGKLRERPITYLDIAHLTGAKREERLRRLAKVASPPIVIVESVVGVSKLPGRVIKVACKIEDSIERLKERGVEVDPHYLSLLDSRIIPAYRVVSSPEGLCEMLKTFTAEEKKPIGRRRERIL